MTSDSHFRTVKVRDVSLNLRSLSVFLFFPIEILLQSTKARALAGWSTDRSCTLTPSTFPTPRNVKVMGGSFPTCTWDGTYYFESPDRGNIETTSKAHFIARNPVSASAYVNNILNSTNSLCKEAWNNEVI